MPGQLPIRLPLRFVLAVFYYLLIRGVLGKHLNLTVKYTSHSCSHIGERGRLLKTTHSNSNSRWQCIEFHCQAWNGFPRGGLPARLVFTSR
jgi:hypothetical protein